MTKMYRVVTDDSGSVVWKDRMDAEIALQSIQAYGYPTARIEEIEMSEEEFAELDPVDSWADYW